MARHESDREDLLREATALVERIELVSGDAEPIVIGFRRDGSGSIYFGQDPVVQFNARNELRRAYYAGRLLKAEDGQLVALSRQRTEQAVYLNRQPLDPAETTSLLTDIQQRLLQLQQALREHTLECRGQVPPGADIYNRALAWLDALLSQPLPTAHRPHAR